MVKGVGIDVVEIERIAKAMRRARFKDRILTQRERRQKETATYVAGRWAAKEAVAKAVCPSISWQSVAILSTENGAPYVEFIDSRHSMKRVHVSISHESGLAAAVAIWEEP
jgi:holo-[acyl-carrier protein] synthase